MKYSKVFLIILSVSLTVNILALDPWICNDEKTHRCPNEHQTCCPSKHADSKYVCFNSPNGVCCPDNENFCPHGTKCNMEALRCDPASSVLSFLSSEIIAPSTDSVVAIDSSLALKSLPNGGEILKFALGFYEGFGIFSNLPKEHDCLDKFEDYSIPTDISKIYELLKELNIHSDFISVIKSISWYAVDIYIKVSDAVAPCKDWSVELKETGLKILSVFTTDKYFEKLGLHALLYMGDFKDKASKGYDALIAGDYKKSGIGFGDLLKFALFWDFKN
jgi:hypothetical protein